MRSAGIILAAGGSTRLGEPKQLITLGGETLVHAAVRAALEGGCDMVCVVTGCAKKAVEQAVADLNPVLVYNAEWQSGMGSSVRLGVGAMHEAGCVVLMTCDQPAVDGKVIRSLLALHDGCGSSIVASAYSGALGVPAVFDRSCFGELLNLPDSGGAQGLIRRDLSRVTPFEFPEGAFDLDTPEALLEWRGRSRAGG